MSPAQDFEVFWGEISPCDHSVQTYDDDAVFLDALEGLVGGRSSPRRTALALLPTREPRLNGELMQVTDSMVDRATQPQRLMAWFASRTMKAWMDPKDYRVRGGILFAQFGPIQYWDVRVEPGIITDGWSLKVRHTEIV